MIRAILETGVVVAAAASLILVLAFVLLATGIAIAFGVSLLEAALSAGGG